MVQKPIIPPAELQDDALEGAAGGTGYGTGQILICERCRKVITGTPVAGRYCSAACESGTAAADAGPRIRGL